MGGGDIAPDSPEQGAAAILHAIDEGLKGQSGCYFKGMKQVDFSSGTVNNLMLHRGGGQR